MIANPDYNLELYHWQDREVETIPKDMDNRTLGYALEAAGEIFREYTGRQWPDGGYIGEKIDRLERLLRYRTDMEELEAVLSDADQERADMLKERWFSLKSLSPRLVTVRNVNIALADQNIPGVRFNLNRIKQLMEAEASGAPTPRRPSPFPVHVREHWRRA